MSGNNNNNYNIVRAKDFDPKKLTFSPVKQNSKGGNVVNVYYDGKPLRLQLPKMRLPFGASLNYNKDGYNVEFSFQGMAESESLKKVHEVLKSFDEALIQAAVDNGVAWFKKKKSREVCEDNFKGPIVRSSDKTREDGSSYPDTIRAKLPRNQEGVFQMEVWNSEKPPKQVTLDEDTEIEDIIPKGCMAVPILQMSSIWFMSGTNYGITIRCAQIQVFKSARSIRGFAIQQDSDNEEEVEVDENDSADEDTPDPEDLSKGDEEEVEVEDSGSEPDGETTIEEEAEEEPEPEPEPEPAPTPAKKTTTKRTTSRTGTAAKGARGTRSTAALKSALARGK